MSDTEEEMPPSTKPRIQLPPLQVPRRRMSSSWTENLEPPPDMKSPPAVKSPEAKPGSSRAFFSRSSSEVKPFSDDEVFASPKTSVTSPLESQRDEVKEDKIEKKEKRRESIKDHLLKFKMKAGKVLEDVHDRLVEDHSSVAPIPSPATPSQDFTSGGEMDEVSSIDGRGKSPTLSQSSKRTSTSAELKASMRSKLRKQAEKTVERKRGSVHLAKRLQRRLTIHQEEGPTEGELQSVDEQIEQTLKIGARFLQEQASMNPPDEVQQAFFVDDYEKEPQPAVIGPITEYRRAEMIEEDDQGQLTYYDPRPQDMEANRPMTSSVMEQRLSPAFFANGKLRIIDESLFVKPLKIIQREEVSYNYVRAEPWETFVDEIRGSDYVQLDIFLGVLCFEQHPLCGDENKIAVRLRTLYDEQLQRINEMTDTLVNIENLPIGGNPSALREHVDLLYRDIRIASEGLQREYAELENCRDRQGYNLTALKYTIDEEDESGSLLGKLTMDNPVTPFAALPQVERNRIDSLKKKSIQVILHFNDILVCKTKSLPLDGYQYKFEQLYNLEIVSEPKTITATVMEKTGTTKKTLAKVNIPLPTEGDAAEGEPAAHRLPFENIENSTTGFLLARASWSSEARTKRRESAPPVQISEDAPFSIIPPGVRLISDEEFETNPRWAALERRSRKRNESGRIPIDASDIDVTSGVHGEDRRQRASFRTAVDGMRALGVAHAVKLRTRLLEREQDASTLSYSEIVREEPLPGLFGAIGSLCGPADLSRKLKPMRRAPARQQNFSPSSLNLVVNVQAATNLPTRTDGQLHSMVEVRFQSATRTTPSVTGKHPNWQHGVSLPIKDTSDPKSIIDCIQLNVYDQSSCSTVQHNSSMYTIYSLHIAERFSTYIGMDRISRSGRSLSHRLVVMMLIMVFMMVVMEWMRHLVHDSVMMMMLFVMWFMVLLMDNYLKWAEFIPALPKIMVNLAEKKTHRWRLMEHRWWWRLLWILLSIGTVTWISLSGVL
ncbi:hypothetical protein Y032_0070g474 [Ancylostoma ceylanicum]|uniref:CC2D2A N-terminal C2 domain-containing protein n=2 Tax=Ancylostoma ceylanicum TaxID=53326 RepID=A0A016TY50_9BILA|nr:hypothetical protein Y032_0070g474 [Ancylostoma ceylanicum]